MSRPRKSIEQAIEDNFADLPNDRQLAILETLTTLHRWCKRIRGERLPKPDAQPEAEVPHEDQ